jgi:hypothetical protein
VYLHLKMGAPAPPELFEWELAERYGWTFDYIESLPMQRVHEYIQIKDARHKAKRK